MVSSIQMWLAIWGAGISSALALLKLYEFFHDRPRLTLIVNLVYSPAKEDEETYGVKVQLKSGPDLLWNEARIKFTIMNSGNKAIQVVSIFVEEKKSITQITPPSLPVVLQSNMQVTVDVQPEFFHGEVVSAGVYDELGKQHRLPKKPFYSLIKEIGSLPLRVGKYKHKETGDLVEAFYVPKRDRIEMISKGGYRRTNC